MKIRVPGAFRAARSRQISVRRCTAEFLEPRQLFAGDLTGAFSGAVPTAFLPGGKNKLTVAVSNTGDADITDAFRVALFASTDQTLDDADTRFASVDKHVKLKAGGGKATNVAFAFPTPSNITDGDYFIFAKIDETNGISENAEDNNNARTSATVQVKQPFVDLTGTTEVTAGSISIVSGKKVKAPKVSLVVGNGGNVPATGTVTANVFASTNTTAGDANDVQLGTVTKKLNTKPGKTTALKPKITIPENLRTGNYNIVATFSYSGPIAESDTDNNTDASSTQFGVDNPAFPPGATVGTLNVDTSVFAVNSAEQVFFDVSITDIPAGDTLTADLIEVDATGAVIGTRVAQLLDNGIATNNDAEANDGIFSASTAIQFTAAGDRFFKARVTNSATSSTTDTPVLTLKGVVAPTEQDVQDAIAAAGSRQAQLTAAVGSGMTTTAAIEATRQQLLTQPDVQASSIQTGSNAIAYLNFKGILTYLSAQARASATSSSPETAPLLFDPSSPELASNLLDCGCGDLMPLADGDPLQACARAIVLSPASATFQDLDPSPAIVNSLLNPVTSDPSASSFSVASRFGADANVDAFKGLGQNKFISISAETFDVPAYGLGIITGQTATTLGNVINLADLASNRLAVSGSGNYVVTPKFFSHYNGDMDGAIVLANADFATKDVGLATTFLRRGAKAFVGFNDSASGPYSRDASQSFVANITDFVVNPTIAQAVASTLDVVGQTDPLRSSTTLTLFGTAEAKLEAGCDLLADNDLLITYSWNENVRDLDTATEFLGDSVGFSCGAGNQFMTFTGDNTSGGGSETVTINLKGAFDDGRFTTSTTVAANAGWFSSAGGSGPAVLTVSLKNKTTGELRQTLSRTISPGTQSGCSATLVGNVTINVTAETNPRVSITLA